MAKRYSGLLTINLAYDGDQYRTSVSRAGKKLWSGHVRPAPIGFGRGIAYDSPQAYDQIASTALTFADDEVAGISDDAETNEAMTGYQIRRTSRASSHAAMHSSKAGPQLDREIAEALAYPFSAIRSGCRVTIVTPHHQQRTGTAVMKGPYGWVLNLGGKHGTPGVATPSNVIMVRNPTTKKR